MEQDGHVQTEKDESNATCLYDDVVAERSTVIRLHLPGFDLAISVQQDKGSTEVATAAMVISELTSKFRAVRRTRVLDDVIESPLHITGQPQWHPQRLQRQ